MKLPVDIEKFVNSHVAQLVDNPTYDLPPVERVELFRLIGPSAGRSSGISLQLAGPKRLPILTAADRIRARMGIIAAQKVSTLWDAACAETDNLHADRSDRENLVSDHQTYLRELLHSSVDEFSVFRVPRSYIPQHILAMAELALQGKVDNVESFLVEANEWWEIYGRPEFFPREYCIKWAAQEALYLSLLWQQYVPEQGHDDSIQVADSSDHFNRHIEAPAGCAMAAFAGVFDGDNPSFDTNKRREFWLWWLTWAIPFAFTLEDEVVR